jgi:hypothetical protein
MKVNLILLSVVMCGLLQIPLLEAGEPADNDEDSWHPAPFWLRDMTFPNLLVLGFAPRSADPVGLGNWAIDVNLSVANAFQVSDGAQDWLDRRGGPRRPLLPEDVGRMIDELAGSHFYLDGEFAVADLGARFGIGSRMTMSLRVSYLRFDGGFMEDPIYRFHDAFGLPQEGREFVKDDRFQLVFFDDDAAYTVLDRPVSGGFADPVLGLAYSLPNRVGRWTFAGEAAVKVPVADSELLLSSGSWDVGLQLTAQCRWSKSAVVINLAHVVPGDFGQSDFFDLHGLSSLNTAFLHRLGRRTTLAVQTLVSDTIFSDSDDGDSDSIAFRLTAGLQIRALGGQLAFGVTENLFEADNAPDLGLHLGYSVVID